MNKKIHVNLLLLCALSALQANEIDELLNVYATKSDLSEQTKKENSGNLILYTRKDLQIMQARNLKDILKSNPFIRYKENRYSIPDIMYNGDFDVTHSNTVRVFIDEQEISTASYGSGFAMLGDIDLDFVDHIEIYSLNPSFEYTIESSILLIKLYSKVAERDKGGKISFSYGTQGFHQENIYHTDTLKEFSYYAYLNHSHDKSASQYSYETPLNKDLERYNAFMSLYTNDQKFQFQGISSQRIGFASSSADATPTHGYHDYDMINIAYYNTMVENLELNFNYAYGSSDFYTEDDSPIACIYGLFCYNSIGTKSTEKTLTAEVKYHINQENNELILGAKYRHKSFEADTIFLNNLNIPKDAYNTQVVGSLYLEDQYSFSSQLMFSAGLQYSFVQNNADIPDDNLMMARLGMTYSDGSWVAKTFGYHTESIVDPYLNFYLFVKNDFLKPQTLQAITQEVRYQPDDDEIKIVLSYINTMDLLTTKNDIHVNKDEDVTSFVGYMEYTYPFNIDNKIILNYSYKNIFKTSEDQNYIRHRGFVRLLDRIGHYDFFNELIIERDTVQEEIFVDYSVGISYHVSDDLTLSLKGENLFDRAAEDLFLRRDPITLENQTPLRSAPIEQRIYATVEYTF